MKQARDFGKKLMRLSSDANDLSSHAGGGGAEPASAPDDMRGACEGTTAERRSSAPETATTTARIADAAFLTRIQLRNRSSALDVAPLEEDEDEDDLDDDPVKTLLRDVERRIDTLRSLLPLPSPGGGSAQDPQPSDGMDDTNEVDIMFDERRRALEGLSSDFRRLRSFLLVCLPRRSGSTINVDGDDPSIPNDELDAFVEKKRGVQSTAKKLRNSLSKSLTETLSAASTQRLLDSANTPSTKTLLHSLLEPEPSHRRHKTSILTKAADAGGAAGDMTIQKGNFSCEIPKELIYDMMRGDDPENSASAAFLATEYGGLELPAKFSGKNHKRKPSLRAIAKKVSISNSFVRRLNVSRCVGMETLEYLPIEFTRLGFKERKRLAHVLSWEGLKLWGFDSFEVEKLSMGTTAEHKPLTARPGVDRTYSTPHLQSGVAIQRMLERGTSSYRMSTSPLSQSANLGETCATVAENEQDNDKLDHSERSNNEEGPELLEISNRGCPVVLIGWALLASPYSQLAMAKNVEDEELIERAQAAIENSRKRKKSFMDSTRSSMSDASFDEGDNLEKDSTVSTTTASSASSPTPNTGWDGGYFFCDKFNITPKSLCQFFRKVEREYSPRTTNPYHNNIHAADVIQATHAIIQMGGAELAQSYVPLEFYSILLAASLHDVRHPGTSNNYQINAQTELAVIYNDTSVLENMHASRASYLLQLGEGKPEEWADGIRGIYGSMNDNDRKLVRTRIIRAILYTDMSRHFSEVAKMNRHVDAVEDDIQDELLELEQRSINDDDLRNIAPVTEPSFLSRIGRDKHVKAREKLLPFILHLADISNATKTHRVSLEWAHAVYDEFFLQGDKEMEEDMPVSPLCDRSTTNRVESQIGFINFVIKPAFLLLARCIPTVEKVIVSQMEKNLKYWEGEKAKAKAEKEKRELLQRQMKEE